MQSHFNEVSRVLKWASENAPAAVSRRLRVSVAGFDRGSPEVLPALTEEHSTSILAAAYRDIDLVLSRLGNGQRLIERDARNAQEEDAKDLLTALLQLGNGLLPSRKELDRMASSYWRRAQALGGLRYLSSLAFPTPSDIFPFYLAIHFQLASNPMSLRLIDADCVRPHELRLDRVWVIWEKGRSNREQCGDFPLGKPRAAPKLIEQMLDMTASMRKFAPDQYRNKLFIALCGRTKVAVPCFQLFHQLLNSFIERHNLPSFVFKQLRRTNATLHFRQSGDIRVAREKLVHANIAQTLEYVDSPEERQRRDRLIHRFQGELVTASKRERETVTSENLELLKPSNHGGKTVFGFDCLDPFSGIAPNSQPGKMCLNFRHCAGCKGALVVLDDVDVVARLLAAKHSLEDAEKRAIRQGWLERFRQLYEPTLVPIRDELLPRVSAEILARAEKRKLSLYTIPILD